MQIGPRVRIGGSVGHLGQNVKTAVGKGVTDAGHAIGDAANNKYVKAATAAALLASGAGAPLAAGIMATEGAVGGGLRRGGSGRDALIGGVKGAAEGYGTAKVGQLVRGGGGGIVSTAKRIGGSAVGAVRKIGSGAESLVDGGGSGGGGGGRGDILDKLLLGAGIATSAADQKRKQDMQNRAEKSVTDDFTRRAPLRTQGQSMALNPNTPDLSTVFSDPGNAYDAQKRGTVGPRVPVRQLTY